MLEPNQWAGFNSQKWLKIFKRNLGIPKRQVPEYQEIENAGQQHDVEPAIFGNCFPERCRIFLGQSSRLGIGLSCCFYHWPFAFRWFGRHWHASYYRKLSLYFTVLLKDKTVLNARNRRANKSS